MEQYTPDWVGYLTTVGILLGLLVLFAYISVRLKTKNFPKWSFSSLPTSQAIKQIEIIEKKVVEPGKNLILIELSGQRWLLGTTPNDIRLIGKLDKIMNTHSQDKQFSEYLDSSAPKEAQSE